MTQRRNDPCACGSGLKYKQCCENQPTRKEWYRYAAGGALALVILIGAVGGIMEWATREPGPPGPAPPGQVWSEEHGHWHNTAPQPPGPPPPGKVWSAEHGHYHDATAGSPPPGGAAPPGKVWSAEHGHYHDAPGAGAGQDDAVNVDDLPPLEGMESSPAPVSTPPPADANG